MMFYGWGSFCFLCEIVDSKTPTKLGKLHQVLYGGLGKCIISLKGMVVRNRRIVYGVDKSSSSSSSS